MKRKGDVESPCQIPLGESNKPRGDPLIKIEKRGVEIQ